MKKVLLIALAVLPVLFACSKGSTGNDEKPSDLTLPKWAEKAAKVVLNADKPITVSTTQGQTTVTEINFLRSGVYVAKGNTSTKADTDVTLTGNYTVGQDGAYVLTGDISATISTSNNSVTVDGGDPIPATVTPATVTAGTTEDKLCRTWKLDHMILKNFEKLGSAGIRVTSVSGLVKTLKEKGITLDGDVEARVLSHEIKEISLGKDLICITFTAANTFVGSWSFSGTSFSYDFKGDMNGDILAASASGTLEFSEKSVTITMNITSENKDLGNGTCIIKLTEKQ